MHRIAYIDPRGFIIGWHSAWLEERAKWLNPVSGLDKATVYATEADAETVAHRLRRRGCTVEVTKFQPYTLNRPLDTKAPGEVRRRGPRQTIQSGRIDPRLT